MKVTMLVVLSKQDFSSFVLEASFKSRTQRLREPSVAHMPFILRRKLKFSLQRGADLAQELTTGARQLRTNNSVPRTNTLITSKQNVLNITITGAEVIFTPQEIAQSARKIQKAQRNSQQFTETQRL